MKLVVMVQRWLAEGRVRGLLMGEVDVMDEWMTGGADENEAQTQFWQANLQHTTNAPDDGD